MNSLIDYALNKRMVRVRFEDSQLIKFIGLESERKNAEIYLNRNEKNFKVQKKKTSFRRIVMDLALTEQK